MKLSLALVLLYGTRFGADAAGAGQWFSYFPEGGLGPSNWPLLATDGNQCGGMGFTTGYGQSPVAITSDVTARCDTDMSKYKFMPGDCTFGDLEYSISNNGVKVAPKADSTCTFGRMNIPHFPDANQLPMKALQFHIHTYSEHSIENEGDNGFYPAELHVVHAQEQEDGSVSTPYAVWGTMIDGTATEPHPIFEHYLRGWEAVALEAEKCAATKAGRELADSENKFVPVVDKNGITTGLGGCYSNGVGGTDWNATGNAGAFDPTIEPDIYSQLTTSDYGVYTLKGGLTTPPCTEIVNWNLMDDSMHLSGEQLQRLEKLIWCYVDTSVCSHATAASQSGSTSRPPQPLLGRKVTHRCRECNNCPEVVDSVPDPSKPPPTFQKPEPQAENPNTSEGKCNKAWTEGCPQDKRANPNVSPNLKANAPLWYDLEGYWVGKYTAQDRNGMLLTENFVNENLTAQIPYYRGDVMMFVNRTIIETRYYEHIYYVYQPADSYGSSVKFCSLPKLEGSKNVLGDGKCGETGYVGHAERFGAATHEKDGIASIFYSNGRFLNATEGTAVPVADKSLYISMRGKETKITETLAFTNDERTKLGGSGQLYLFKDFEPYLSDPHEETFTYFLDQVSKEDFTTQLEAAYKSNNVLENEQIPTPQTTKCLDTEFCPTETQFAQVDPLSTATPYSENVGGSGWFIAVMVILGLLVVLAILYYLHQRQLAQQKERISRQFARRVAETIKVEGSHTQLTAEALEEEFKRIDADHNGYLSKSELKAFVNSGKIGTMTDADFNALFAALDVDHNGTVDFTEFCAFMAQCGQVYDQEESHLSPEERRQSIAKRMGSLQAKDQGV